MSLYFSGGRSLKRLSSSTVTGELLCNFCQMRKFIICLSFKNYLTMLSWNVMTKWLKVFIFYFFNSQQLNLMDKLIIIFLKFYEFFNIFFKFAWWTNSFYRIIFYFFPLIASFLIKKIILQLMNVNEALLNGVISRPKGWVGQ